MISTRGSADRALAISSSCRSATPSPGPACRARSRRRARRAPTAASRFMRRPVDRRRAGRGAGARRRGSPPRTGRGRRTVPGTWRRCRAVGRVRAADPLLFPARGSRPSPAEWTPVRILTSVDLPASFSPTSAWTFPARSSRSTSLNACTPPKLRDAAKLDEGRGGRRAHLGYAAPEAAVDVEDVSRGLRRASPTRGRRSPRPRPRGRR